MRILHVVPSYRPAWRYGGTIRSVHALCRGLSGLGHDVHVYTTDVDGRASLDVPLGKPVDVEGVRVWYFHSSFLRRLYYSPAMARALSGPAGAFELFHLHSVFLWPTAAGASAAKRFGRPFVLSPRGMLVKSLVRRRSRLVKSAWIRLIERRNLEAAAAVHVTSELERRELESFGFRLPPVYVVPNAVEAEPAAEAPPAFLKELGGGPFVLYLGRVNWKKGLDRLIPAMALVPGTRLVIAGNDEERYAPALKRLAAEKGVEERVVFLGEVRGADKWALLRAAAALALPSYGENFGNVVLEAMAAGCPVVVTPEVGAAPIVLESGAGLVVDGRPEAFGESLRALVGDAALRRRMGEAGRAAGGRFGERAVAKRMEDVYTEILSSGGRRGGK
jgi:glycosyltransferase involved in cell wall biosynthesis